MMKKLMLAVCLLAAVCVNGWACTNLIVGKKASADGSVIVSYSADSYGMYGFLCHYPAAVHAWVPCVIFMNGTRASIWDR